MEKRVSADRSNLRRSSCGLPADPESVTSVLMRDTQGRPDGQQRRHGWKGEVRCADGGWGGGMRLPAEDASSHQEPEEAGRVVSPGVVQPCQRLDALFPTCRLGENTFLWS